MSPSSDAALVHLKRIKPNDGWAVETKGSGSTSTVRLLRRNVPLTDNFFLDLYVDRAGTKGQVVGILATSKTTNNETTLAQVLVDERGQPAKAGSKQLLQVRGWQPGGTTTAQRSTPSDAGSSEDLDMTIMAAKYIGMVMAGMILLRLLTSALYGLVFLAVPVAYLYLLQTIPPVESFDAKKELKRVFRGQHLPENHVDKPQGFFEKAMARVNASVTTELLSMPGYAVEMMTLAGAVHVATVSLPSGNLEAYWIGAAGQWKYIFSRELESSKAD